MTEPTGVYQTCANCEFYGIGYKNDPCRLCRFIGGDATKFKPKSVATTPQPAPTANVHYVVMMNRYGNSEKHSYVLSVHHTRRDAEIAGADEEEYRAWKYKAEIIECDPNSAAELGVNAEISELRNENARLEAKITAYEHDLPLLAATEKIAALTAELAELKAK